ncbi:M20/M25/M40 family metallo-hydrolase [Variovorax sp. UC74_104]|uniref:M20/M25/M40 family metallo-hydrolase n=1 Tax=Variovorax sp. UC74_104 TaxID=3374555 RepID=UPI0037568905
MGLPATWTTSAATARWSTIRPWPSGCARWWSRALRRQRCSLSAPLPNSEDFSAFLKHAPGVYVFIGARSAAKGIVHPHHHPHFDFDEDALLHGVQLFANAPFHLNA